MRGFGPIEGRLAKRAAEAMRRRNVDKLAEVVNTALRRTAVRSAGREEELTARLDAARAERDRLVDAIASGGEAFASVRDRLAAVEQEIATITADVERARFESRAARTPTAIDPRALRNYLRALRRAVRHDIPAAKASLAQLLDGDLVLWPSTATEPARVTGKISPSGVAGAGQFIAGS